MKAIIAFSVMLLMFAFVTPVQAVVSQDLEIASVSIHHDYDVLEQKNVLNFESLQTSVLQSEHILSKQTIENIQYAVIISPLAMTTNESTLGITNRGGGKSQAVSYRKLQRQHMFKGFKAKRKILWFRI